MKRLLPALLCSLVSVVASAQVRTFVATTGVDTNPCSRSAPCRNFDAAVAAVAPNGEVVALDTGGYGPVLINKSVTVLAPAGVHAAIAPTSGNAITVNAAGAIVTLRNLYLNSQGGIDGIDFAVGSELHIANLVFSGFSGTGLFGHASLSSFTITDSHFRGGSWGVLTFGPNSIQGSIASTRFDSNGAGIEVQNARVIASDSVFFKNQDGVRLGGGSSGSEITLERCVISAGTNGINGAAQAGSGTSTARLSEVMIVHTTTGLAETGDLDTNLFVSFGNNRFAANGADGTFDTTIALK